MRTSTIAASLFSQLKTRIEARHPRIGVIGLDCVGLSLALLYAEEHFRVTGFDIDLHEVETLNSGGTYIYRIPPREVQAAALHGFEPDRHGWQFRGCGVRANLSLRDLHSQLWRERAHPDSNGWSIEKEDWPG